ncbi:RNA-binding domain-containing protein [Phanerochaete sordida]|uniref:RNA-binding domain-containing protein n=1 Tax=Phanerochaete sordida TaxID=48140 RepID=A0A9P3LCG1_9APHY|nr:RNA-binding domain-containing protein [Phanerochaete sordida]
MLKLPLSRLSLRQSARKPAWASSVCLRCQVATTKSPLIRNQSSWARRLQEEPDPEPSAEETSAEKEPPEQSSPVDNSHLQAMFALARDYTQPAADKAAAVAQARAARMQYADGEPTPERAASSSVRIEYLPQKMTEDDIRELFSPFGKIAHIKILETSGERLASVTFSSSAEAEALVDANTATPLMFEEAELDIRFGSLTHENPPSRTLFVQDFGADPSETEVTLYDMFRQYGTVTGIRQAMNKAAWFVTFQSVKDAAAVMEQHQLIPFRYFKQILHVNYEVTTSTFDRNAHHTLCITGFRGTAGELLQHMPTFDGGEHIVKITSVPDKTGTRPPLFFVEFEAVEYATRALDYIREHPDVSFAAKYAGKPNDWRAKTRSLFEPIESFDPFGPSPSRRREWKGKARR